MVWVNLSCIYGLVFNIVKLIKWTSVNAFKSSLVLNRSHAWSRDFVAYEMKRHQETSRWMCEQKICHRHNFWLNSNINKFLPPHFINTARLHRVLFCPFRYHHQWKEICLPEAIIEFCTMSWFFPLIVRWRRFFA